MKKVRYLAGAAGLLPAAAAFMAPAAAHAVTHTQNAPSHARTKSTSLRVVYLNGARPGEEGGCGSVPTGWINHNHMSIRFWYNYAGCVGTVELMLYPENVSSCVYADFHIYPHDAASYSWKSKLTNYCTKTELIIGVQKTFPTPLGVWGQGWSYTSENKMILGAVGKNVDPPF
jgi:hypothetical protein